MERCLLVILLICVSSEAKHRYHGKSDLRKETTSKFITSVKSIENEGETIEVTTCQRFPGNLPGADLELMCSKGQVISIHHAQWGRTRPEKDPMCPCTSYCWLQNIKNCVSSRSLGKVKSRCEGKQNCRVIPMNDLFGNPCPGVLKYLQVRYSCKDKEEWALSDKGKKTRDGFELTTCERYPGRLPTSDIKIQCPAGQRVHINHAFYGRKTHDTYCNHYFVKKDKETTCAADNALKIVKSYCEGRHGCTVPPTNNAFGNPCQGVYKYLQVHYICQMPTETDKEMEAKLISEGTEVTSCERFRGNPPGNDLVMHCPAGHVITIEKALWGRKVGQDVLCPCKAYCDKTLNTNCEATAAPSIVKKKCEGRSFCVVQPTNTVFGNPCKGTLKYLQVKYKCKPSPYADASTGGVYRASMAAFDHALGRKLVVKEDFRRVRACQRQTVQITCKKHEKIEIFNATFGRSEPAEKVCPPPFPANCRDYQSKGHVSRLCNNKQSCTVKATGKTFKDRCPGTDKALEVHFTCKASVGQKRFNRYRRASGDLRKMTLCKDNQEETLSCEDGEKISISYANYGRTEAAKKTCGWEADVCSSKDSLDVVKEECTGKQSCMVYAHKSVFKHDPCPMTYKYLQVDYRCVGDGEVDVLEITDTEADNPLEIDAAEEILETSIDTDEEDEDEEEGEEEEDDVDEEEDNPDIDVDKVILTGIDTSVDDKIIDFFGRDH